MTEVLVVSKTARYGEPHYCVNGVKIWRIGDRYIIARAPHASAYRTALAFISEYPTTLTYLRRYVNKSVIYSLAKYGAIYQLSAGTPIFYKDPIESLSQLVREFILPGLYHKDDVTMRLIGRVLGVVCKSDFKGGRVSVTVNKMARRLNAYVNPRILGGLFKRLTDEVGGAVVKTARGNMYILEAAGLRSWCNGVFKR